MILNKTFLFASILIALFYFINGLNAKKESSARCIRGNNTILNNPEAISFTERVRNVFNSNFLNKS
jgi:hypothetical protein